MDFHIPLPSWNEMKWLLVGVAIGLVLMGIVMQVRLGRQWKYYRKRNDRLLNDLDEAGKKIDAFEKLERDKPSEEY